MPVQKYELPRKALLIFGLRLELLKVFNLLIITEVKLRKYLKSDEFAELESNAQNAVSKSVATPTSAPQRATPAPQRATPAPQRATPAPQRATLAPQRATPAPQRAIPAPQRATPAPQRAVDAQPAAAPQRAVSAQSAVADSEPSSDPEIVDDATVAAAAPSDIAVDGDHAVDGAPFKN